MVISVVVWLAFARFLVGVARGSGYVGCAVPVAVGAARTLEAIQTILPLGYANCVHFEPSS